MQNHNVKINPLGVKNSAYPTIRSESAENPGAPGIESEFHYDLNKQSQFSKGRNERKVFPFNGLWGL